MTGANVGLGLEIAKRLAAGQAHVVMACRNLSKADAARTKLLGKLGRKAQLTTLQLDLSSLESVKSFAREFERRFDRLDVLMCNAGVMALKEREVTADGFEKQLATNHLGHFLLTGLLMGMLRRTEGSRVVTQSSSAGWVGSFDWADLNGEKGYSRWKQYGMTKLANVTFINELNRRVTEAGAEWPKGFSVHPGVVVGQLQAVAAGGSMLERMVYKMFDMVGGTYEQGALPALYACVAPEAAVGEFYGPDGFYGGALRGNHPAVVRPNRLALDEGEMRKLWEVSEEMTGFKFEL